MTKREKRRHAALVKQAWSKEWLAELDDRDLEIVYGVAQSTLLPRIRSLDNSELTKLRFIEREKKRRECLLATALK